MRTPVDGTHCVGWLTRVVRTSLAGDTAWSFGAEAIRMVGGLAVFFVLVRALGTDGFGEFAAIAAVVAFVVPLAQVGASLLLVQRVRRDDHSIDDAFATAFTMVIVGGVVASLFTVGGVALVPGLSVSATAWLCAGELLGGAVTSLCAYTAIAAGRLRVYAQTTAILTGVRVAAAIALLSTGSTSVVKWALLQAIALSVTGGVILVRTRRTFGVHRTWARIRRYDVLEGAPYSASLAVFSAQDGIDKPILRSAGWINDAGLYGAAYRVPTLAMLPIQALLVASYNRTFTEGKRGLAATMAFARRLLAPSVAYAVVVGALMVLAAPLCVPILGKEFADAVPIVRWLGLLPLLRVLQYFPANALTGAGYQRVRLWLLISTLVINLALCLAWIPDHSWRGALAATFVGETWYVVVLWVATRWLLAVEGRRPSVVPA